MKIRQKNVFSPQFLLGASSVATRTGSHET